MEIDQILGLPAHPLLVHIPVVLVPLATIGAVLVAVKVSWRRSLAVVVAVLAIGGAVGVFLATQSGEALEERVEEEARGTSGSFEEARSAEATREEGERGEGEGEEGERGEGGERGEEAVEEHADKGEAARPFVALFALLAVGVAVVDHLARRDGVDDARKATLAKILPVLLVLSVVSGGVASYMVYEAGHSGAKATWSET
jgi:hypothetical protein